MKIRLAFAVLATFAVQWALGMPGAGPWAQWLLLPMVWLVAPPMRHRFEHAFWIGLGLGLAWDLLFEPIVGPGLIAWSAAALAISWIVRKVGDRSAKFWGFLGAGGTVLVAALRQVALLPLGLAHLPQPEQLATGALATGLWCALVATVGAMDIPARINRYRRSRLR